MSGERFLCQKQRDSRRKEFQHNQLVQDLTNIHLSFIGMSQNFEFLIFSQLSINLFIFSLYYLIIIIILNEVKRYFCHSTKIRRTIITLLTKLRYWFKDNNGKLKFILTDNDFNRIHKHLLQQMYTILYIVPIKVLLE